MNFIIKGFRTIVVIFKDEDNSPKSLNDKKRVILSNINHLLAHT